MTQTTPEGTARSSKPITYAQLLETNNLMQHVADQSYWLCLTRTVQESKLFPVSSYIVYSYLNAFYRYPELLRKIEAQMPAEELADRARQMGVKIQAPHVAWCMPAFYLLGREMLISYGMIRPQDAVEDVIDVLDFWKRFQLSWHRNNGHRSAAEAGQRAQILPDRTVEAFKAGMYAITPGDELHEAAHAFMATASQYGFLVSCESRMSLANSGPYRVDAEHEMLVRDFMDLSESSLPWLDGIASEVPFNNFTVSMLVKDCHFNLVDDWGSFESEPAFTADKLVGIGLYVSDGLSEGHVPLGMDSRDELIATFRTLNRVLKQAMEKLWLLMAEWTREQLLEAGSLVYFACVKDLAHVAGVFEVEDWLEVDPRAERFRTLFNDEYGNLLLAELVGTLGLPSHQRASAVMAPLSDRPVGLLTPLPLSILAGEDYVASSGPIRKGTTRLAPKQDRYRTTQGLLGLEEYNRRAREFVPAECEDRMRFLCETWVKYHPDDPRAEELYALVRRPSLSLAKDTVLAGDA